MQGISMMYVTACLDLLQREFGAKGSFNVPPQRSPPDSLVRTAGSG
jgi:hypothetical protein